MENLHRVRKSLTEEGILICFNGPFSHGIIEELGRAVKKYLETEEIQKSSLMDVFAVYIEATQNVNNYANLPGISEAERQRRNAGIIVIARQGSHYVVRSGNPVRREDGQALAQRLDQLASLDKAALKALYKEQMRRDPGPGGGAGLGLIDMARKAAEPLVHSLVEDEDGYDFFSLRVVI